MSDRKKLLKADPCHRQEKVAGADPVAMVAALTGLEARPVEADPLDVPLRRRKALSGRRAGFRRVPDPVRPRGGRHKRRYVKAHWLDVLLAAMEPGELHTRAEIRRAVEPHGMSYDYVKAFARYAMQRGYIRQVDVLRRPAEWQSGESRYALQLAERGVQRRLMGYGVGRYPGTGDRPS